MVPGDIVQLPGFAVVHPAIASLVAEVAPCRVGSGMAVQAVGVVKNGDRRWHRSVMRRYLVAQVALLGGLGALYLVAQ